MIYTGVAIVYCFLSYWIVPRPDYSNMGLLGGLIDHPKLVLTGTKEFSSSLTPLPTEIDDTKEILWKLYQ